jgi:anion transporter
MAVVSFMLVLFITAAVPIAIAGLLGCLGFWVLCGLPFKDAFSGFASDTPWFIMATLFIGAMAEKSLIPERLVYLFLRRFGSSYKVILASLIFLDFVLTFIIPTGAARVAILCTIAVGVVNALGTGLKSNVAKGMILVLTFSATVFDKTILAGAASILSRGMIEAQTGEAVSWAAWFVAYAPVDLVLLAACWLATLKLFPPEIKVMDTASQRAHAQARLDEMGKVSFPQVRAMALILLATVLWATDFLHGISPAKIGICIGLLAFVPYVGNLDGGDLKAVNFPVVIFIGAVLSMGNIMTGTSLLTSMSEAFFEWLAPLRAFQPLLMLALYLCANVFHLFLGNEPALLAATMPLVMDFAAGNDLSPTAIGMAWTFAAGGKLFIYQSGVLALGYSFGAFKGRDLFKLGLVLIIVEALCVSLIVPFYWALIGMPISL